MARMWSAECWVAGVLLSGCAVGAATAPHGHTPPAPPSYQLHLARVSAADPRKESPTAQACKSGVSKACDEIGDRLMVKHAYSEARQWYALACERARGAMVPTATQLLQLSHDLGQPNTPPVRSAALKGDASELAARLHGCLDVAETLRAEHELALALPYYETVCEFSALAEAVGDRLPAFSAVVERSCTGTQTARGALHSAAFAPSLFGDLAQQARADSAEEASAKAVSEQGTDMVFSMSEL
jgi:hypothetical protein